MTPFNVLGPLEVVRDSVPVPLGGLRRRATLAYLLLNANRPVPVDRLVDALWHEEQPQSARKILQNAVSSLRRSDDLLCSIVTCRDGYLLRVAPQHIDASRFRDLAAHGRRELADGAWEDAAATLRRALGLWRGEALADLLEVGLCWPELTELNEAGVAAFEDRVTADLMLGRHTDVVAELAVALDADPARERMCGQLMLALYRSGRHTDALDAYRRTCRTLAADPGLAPDDRLSRLANEILMHDPVLISTEPVRRFVDWPHRPPDPGAAADGMVRNGLRHLRTS
ncbi:AfsR/SARP family transcriptional regulator [Yinghuangia soli]|uniref:AfsR/SARP family transcriptional regulator n=1 Tax=Yinghuangia soli TaxID=2908204 RepID=A0AA41PZL9_9ACTN|nr:AfsR/SARP family transcriptional regulator [Yinghuangia soli]MCF2528844.1 AfsR/SARP family transcriptional regulator [Yinghuangia soli]